MSTVSVATTVKSGLPTICHFLDYHLGIGVHRFYLFLDDCEPDILGQIRSRYPLRVSAQDCDAAYWRDEHGIARPESVEERQRLNADHALSLARKNGDRWIVHIDVDEYINAAADDLPTVLGSVPNRCNVVRMDVLECIPTSLEFQSVSEIRYFKSLPYGVPLADDRYALGSRLRRSCALFAYKALLILAKFFGRSFARAGFHDFYNAHSMGKCITRVSDDVQSLRLHIPWFVEGVKMHVYSTPRCRLLHFESWSFTEWSRKWQRRSSIDGFAAALDRRQQAIFDQFKDCASRPRELEALYRKLYFYSDAELRCLRFLGLVKVVDLPRTHP